MRTLLAIVLTAVSVLFWATLLKQISIIDSYSPDVIARAGVKYPGFRDYFMGVTTILVAAFNWWMAYRGAKE